MTCINEKAKNAKIVNKSPFSCKKIRKVNDSKPILSIVITPTNRNQKVEDVKFHAKDAIKKTCTGHIIKLSIKAKDAKKILLNLQKTFFLKQS